MAKSTITKEQMKFITSMIFDNTFFYSILNSDDRGELWAMNEGSIIGFDDRKQLNKIREKWIDYKS